MTNVEIEKVVTGLTAQVEDMRNAIRNLSNQQNSLTDMIAKMNQNMLDLKTELAKVKGSIPKVKPASGNTGASSY